MKIQIRSYGYLSISRKNGLMVKHQSLRAKPISIVRVTSSALWLLEALNQK
jgi:hypothetical protein